MPLFDIVEEKEEENEERARPIQHDGAVKRFAEPPRSVPIPHCFFTNSSSLQGRTQAAQAEAVTLPASLPSFARVAFHTSTAGFVSQYYGEAE